MRALDLEMARDGSGIGWGPELRAMWKWATEVVRDGTGRLEL